ncbi:glycoside hydrolase family 26 protein [Frondihabitans cladoniiphilus]
MITPLSQGRSFWTTGKKNRRKTALGATTIVVLLALISWLVWMSPSDNIVRKAVSDVVQPIAGDATLKSDRANLLSQLVSSKSAMSNQQAELAKIKAQLAAANGKSTALQQQLSAASAAESAAEGKAASLSAQVAAAGSHAGTAKAVTPAKSTTAAVGPVVPQAGTLDSLIHPASRQFGLYTDQSPFNWAENDLVASDLSAQPSIAGYFQGWDTDFRADAVQRAWAKGETPLLTWESQSNSSSTTTTANQAAYSLGNIINGNFDAYLKKYADDIVANGQPLGIRLDQEMNANWYPWGEGANGNSKGQFVLMWQHVHDIFAAEGANAYVDWIWAPNRVDGLSAANGMQKESYLLSFYPGDAYVDQVGMSAYLRPPYSTGETYSFDHTFGTTLTQLRDIAPGKPILLAETGASEIGNQKAAWITSLFTALSNPVNNDIVGVDWFNHVVTSTTSGVQYTNDWRIQSSNGSIAAFKSGLALVASNPQAFQFALKPVS